MRAHERESKERRERRERRARREKAKKLRRILSVCGIVALFFVAFLFVKVVGKVTGNKKSGQTRKVEAREDSAAGQTTKNGKITAAPDEEPSVTSTPTPSPDPRPHYEVPKFTKTKDTISIPADPDPLVYDDIYELTPLADAAKPFKEDEDPTKSKYLQSSYMILVDLESGNVVAERSSDTIISPASMTKILTVLTAMDYITEADLDKKVKISQDIVDYYIINECSAVGYQADMEITVRELLYGTIVCSGADAAMALAEYVAGSQEKFVELMNKRVEEFGLSGSAHFTNVVGMYDENLHCKVGDIAVILACAMQNELLSEILGTRRCMSSVYTEDGTQQEISNWFLRRIEDYETNGNVIGAKTGFVEKAGSCAASMLETPAGKRYICVTGNADSSWRCIYDHISVYRSFTK